MSWSAVQQEALLSTIQRRNERDILVKQLAWTKDELAKRQEEQSVLYNQWQNEQADVDRLTRLSWASVFYDLLRRKTEQLSKEEAEAKQAQLRYDVICATVIDLQQQRDSQEKRLSDYVNIDADYDQLILKKRAALVIGLGDGYDQYQRHLTNLTQGNRYVQELDEARNAGMIALNEVMQLVKLLDQARNWGAWDVMGGSAFSSLLKYRKLDDVRAQSYRVTRSLEQFRAEYADIKQTFLVDWQFDGGLTRFVDIFFDNIFTDMAVQSRINNALTTAMALENQLVATLTNLKNQVEHSVETTKQKSAELQRFLETV